MSAAVLTALACALGLALTMLAARAARREGFVLFAWVVGASSLACVLAAVMDSMASAELSWTSINLVLIIGVVAGITHAKRRLAS